MLLLSSISCSWFYFRTFEFCFIIFLTFLFIIIVRVFFNVPDPFLSSHVSCLILLLEFWYLHFIFLFPFFLALIIFVHAASTIEFSFGLSFFLGGVLLLVSIVGILSLQDESNEFLGHFSDAILLWIKTNGVGCQHVDVWCKASLACVIIGWESFQNELQAHTHLNKTMVERIDVDVDWQKENLPNSWFISLNFFDLSLIMLPRSRRECTAIFKGIFIN